MGCISNKRGIIISNQLKELNKSPANGFTNNLLKNNLSDPIHKSQDKDQDSPVIFPKPSDDFLKRRLRKSFLFTKKYFGVESLTFNPIEEINNYKSQSNKLNSNRSPSLLSSNVQINRNQKKMDSNMKDYSPISPMKESHSLFDIASNDESSPTKVFRKIVINPYRNFNTIKKFFVYQLRKILLHTKKCPNEQRSIGELRENSQLSYFEVFSNYSNIAAQEANTFKKFDDKNIQINDYYIYKSKILGIGIESYVYLCQNLKKNVLYAVKIYNKKKQDYNEVNIIKRLHSKYIVAVYEIIETQSEKYIIMEFMQNNSLRFNLLSLDIFCIWKYFRNLVSAVEHCHEIAKVVHLNISLNHCLIDDNDLLKLSNFSQGQIIEDNQPIRLSTQKIIPMLDVYPPEVAFSNEKDKYDGKAIDIWMLGNILYLMVFGHNFVKNNGKNIEDYSTDNIKHAEDGLSELLCCLLEKSPQKRYTIDEIKKNNWITHYQEFPMPDLHEEALEYCYYLTSKEMQEQSR